MPKNELSFNGKRIVLGIALFICLLCVINYYFNFGIFGRFAKQVMIGGFILLVLIQHFVGPSFTEVQEYRDKQRQSRVNY
jgi:hypothetical protein